MGVFKHKDAGTRLGRAEDNANDRHACNGQATNDLLQFDGVTWANATLATVKTLLALNNVENTVHSTDAHTMAIDGRDVSADGTKLDGIESSATADQTGAEIKSAYEGEADTNAYDDAAVSKLGGIATGADVTGDNTPQAHTHNVGGYSGLLADDQHVLDAEVVTAAKTVKLDELSATTDVTTLDSSTSAHGLLKKLDNNPANFMNGQGNWAAAGGGGTMEFWSPVTYGSLMNVQGDFAGGKCSTSGQVAYVAFKVPNDFSSITNAEIVVIPLYTQASNDWDIDSDYGAVGEAHTANSETDSATTYGTAANQLFAIDVSGILSSLAAEDYVGIKLTLSNNSHDFVAIGFRLRYS